MNIFALKSSIDFAELVAKELGIELSEHEEIEFEDGEHKVRPLVSVRRKDVFVIHSLYGEEQESVNDKMCRLLFFVSALKDASAKSVTVIVPYLCYTRKDRKTKSRDPVTTRYVAALFESAGADCLVTIDVHNLQAFQNAFRCRTEHLEARNLFADYFSPLIANETAVIMSPDIGGIKRVEQFQRELNKRLDKDISIAFMEKYRSKGIVSGHTLVGEVRDRTVIILDDLISSGATLARSAIACKQSGAKNVLAVATHGVFTAKASEMLREDSLQKIVVTNTIPPIRIEGSPVKEKIVVLNVAPLFAKAIKRIYEGGSIVELLGEEY